MGIRLRLGQSGQKRRGFDGSDPERHSVDVWGIGIGREIDVLVHPRENSV